MKLVFVFVTALIFASCSATPTQIQPVLSDTSAALHTVAATAAVVPDGSKVAADAAKAAAVVDASNAAVATALANQTASNDKLTVALNNLSTVTSAAAAGVHAAVPGTPADNYTSLAAVLVLGISKIVSSVQSRKSIESVSTGTTSAPTDKG